MSPSFLAPLSVYVSEVMANPKGADSGSEWLEISNPTLEVVSISGWTALLGGKKIYLNGKVAGGRTIVYPAKNIPNDADFLVLKNAKGEVVQKVIIPVAFAENKTFNTNDKGVSYFGNPSAGVAGVFYEGQEVYAGQFAHGYPVWVSALAFSLCFSALVIFLINRWYVKSANT